MTSAIRKHGESLRLHCNRIERIARTAEDLSRMIGDEAAAVRAGERPDRTLGSLESACCTLQRISEFVSWLSSQPEHSQDMLLDLAARWGRGDR